MSRRTVVAGALGLAGLALGLALFSQDLLPLGPEVILADASAITLDTVQVRGRRIEASVNGTVVEVGEAGRVVLALPDGAVSLRLPEAAALRIEDRVLAVGRLRARRGGRYLEGHSWVVVSGEARPPAAGGL